MREFGQHPDLRRGGLMLGSRAFNASLQNGVFRVEDGVIVGIDEDGE